MWPRSLSLTIYFLALLGTANCCISASNYSFDHFSTGVEGIPSFSGPQHITQDDDGNFYVSETNGAIVRKVSSIGEVTTIAGQYFVQSARDGEGSLARFFGPSEVVFHKSGALYLRDKSYGPDRITNETVSYTAIRKVTPEGLVSTLNYYRKVQGNEEEGEILLKDALGLATDDTGNLYMASGHAIIKIDESGAIELYGGKYDEEGDLDGDKQTARFREPFLLTTDSESNLYILEKSGRIRKIATSGEVSTIVPNPDKYYSDNPALRIGNLAGIAIDNQNNIYISDSQQDRIYKVSGGTVDLYYGKGPETDIRDPRFRTLNQPKGIVVEHYGSLVLCHKKTLLRIHNNLTVQGLAGYPGSNGKSDGQNYASGYGSLNGLDFDSAGNLYAVDASNHVVHKITPEGVSFVYAGVTGEKGLKNGPADQALFDIPLSIYVAPNDEIYVTDFDVVRKISTDGSVSTYAGNRHGGDYLDGPVADAVFGQLRGIDGDTEGNLYVADDNYTVRKISAAGIVSTLAGTPHYRNSIDGNVSDAGFSYIADLKVGPNNEVYVLESSTHKVRKIDAELGIRTLLDIPERSDPTQPLIGYFTALEVDHNGEIFFGSDLGRIFTMESEEEATIVGGHLSLLEGTDLRAGVGEEAFFSGIQALVFDGDGNLFVGDSHHTIMKGTVVNGELASITDHPEDLLLAYGDPASFQVEFSSQDPVEFQWQKQAFGDRNWVSLTDDDNIFGSKTSELSIDSVTVALHRDQYRCQLRNSAGIHVSQPAELEVIEPFIQITHQPQDRVTTNGFFAFFDVWALTVPNQAIGIWQISTDEGTNWTNLEESETYRNVEAGNLVVKVTPEMDGHMFRSIIYNGWVAPIISDEVTLSVPPESLLDVKTIAWVKGGKQYFDGTDIYHVADFKKMACDPDGNLFVAGGSSILKIPPVEGKVLGTHLPGVPNGIPERFAGNPNETGYLDGIGEAARFGLIRDIASDQYGNIFVVEDNNAIIRKIKPNGTVTTIAGKHNDWGYVDGPHDSARFVTLHGITTDKNNNIYVSDLGNYSIRKISATGHVSTIAGVPGQRGYKDGGPDEALFYNISKLEVDSHGNIFVIDGQAIRKVTPDGTVTTFAGVWEQDGPSYRDGPGSIARFRVPMDIAIDRSDNLYVVDHFQDLVRKITPDGFVTTVAGLYNQYWFPLGGYPEGHYEDGFGADSRFMAPNSIAIDTTDNLYIGDSHAAGIRIGSPQGIRLDQGPIHKDVRIGGTTSFSISSYSDESVSFEWQVSEDSGKTWSPISANVIYQGENSPTLIITNAEDGLSGYQYRCVLSNGIDAPFYSSRAHLTVRETNHLEHWRMTHFGSFDDSGEGSNDNDQDKDGIPNLFEYVYDLDPKNPNQSPLPSTLLKDNGLFLEFLQPEKDTDLVWEVQFSTTLNKEDWYPIGSETYLPFHRYRIDASPGDPTFLRILLNPRTE